MGIKELDVMPKDYSAYIIILVASFLKNPGYFALLHSLKIFIG